MRDTKIGILPLDPNIDKTKRVLRKIVRIARQRKNKMEIIPINDYSYDESEMGDENPRITLRVYGRLDNLDEMS